MAMVDRCRTIAGVFIPGCMGSAARGREYCTCYEGRAVKDWRDKLEERVDQLEMKFAILCGKRQAGAK